MRFSFGALLLSLLLIVFGSVAALTVVLLWLSPDISPNNPLQRGSVVNEVFLIDANGRCLRSSTHAAPGRGLWLWVADSECQRETLKGIGRKAAETSVDGGSGLMAEGPWAPYSWTTPTVGPANAPGDYVLKGYPNSSSELHCVSGGGNCMVWHADGSWETTHDRQ